MQFGEYLRSCRLGCELTQEELVSEIYQYDIEHFENLEVSTISKWECNSTHPSPSRQLSLLKFFQKKTGLAFPHFPQYTIEELESHISNVAMQNLLGNAKEVVLNFPSTSIKLEDLHVRKISEIETINKILDINLKLNVEFNYGLSKLSFEHFKSWAECPHNIFYVCELNEQFFGLLFTLRLKPDIFTKLINFEMMEKDIRVEDFASHNEIGSDYFLSFIAMNEKVASLLFIEYYAQLIAHQENILEVGGMTMVEDAKKLISNMCIASHKKRKRTAEDGENILQESYRANMHDFLACEQVIRMLFSKEKA